MAMQRSHFPKSLQEGLNAIFGLNYRKFPEEWRKVFDAKTSRKAFEEQVLRSGLGAAPIKSEGAAIDEDSGAEAWTARYTHVTVEMRFALTQEALEDNLYDALGAQYAGELARAILESKELISANVLNNGFSASYPIGDTKAMLATDHPLYGGGTFSNKLAVAANLSESALEDILTQIANAVNERSLPIPINPVRLIIGTGNIFTATRILRSMQRVGTPDNDINAIKSLGIFSEDPHVLRRLTNTNAWFVKTDAPLGLQMFERIKLEKRTFEEEVTGNYVMSARSRFSPGITDPRGIYGSEGA